MKRRDFIRMLGGAACMWPLTTGAQGGALPVIGFLSPGSAEADAGRLDAFRRGLAEINYVEGYNVSIEYRWAQYQYDQLPALAADLVGRQVTVIVTIGYVGTLAAKKATDTIPIVFSTGADPVQVSLITSLDRPNGNVTGITMLHAAVVGARLKQLREMIPAASAVALLTHPSSAFAEPETKALHEAARALGVDVRILNAANEREIDAAFAIIAKERPGPLVVSADNFFTDQLAWIARLASRHAIPAISAYREFTAAGGLMSYGANLADAYRQVGTYAGRILKGAKPTDLPVEQARLESTLNVTTARALGITVPLELLYLANTVQ